MARARNIKPGFFENEELAELGPHAMLLFAGLWTLADREGRLEDRPKRIKAQLFPYFDIDADALLEALREGGFIVRYQVGSSRFLQVANFSKHQNPHVRETPSIIPPAEGHTKGEPKADIGDVEPGGFSDSLSLDSLIPDSGLLGGAQDAPAKPRRAQHVPEDWGPTEKDREWALGEGLTDAEMVRETPKFIRHHRSKGNVFKDISAAWKNWMVKSREWGAARSPPYGTESKLNAAQRFARMAMEDAG